MQELPSKIDSKFRFVLICASRAEQMMRGARPKVESGEQKYSRVAVTEVFHDLVEWDYGPAEEPEAPAEVEAGDAEAPADAE